MLPSKKETRNTTKTAFTTHDHQNITTSVSHDATVAEAHCVLRVQVKGSPYLDLYHDHHAHRLTLDSGAEANLIRASVAHQLGATIKHTSQTAYQANGKTPMNIIGETTIMFTRGDKSFKFEGLVASDLEVDILGGVPFLDINDITLRVKNKWVILSDGTKYTYGTPERDDEHHSINRVQAHVLRSPRTTTIWPGEYLELVLPEGVAKGGPLALEPRSGAPSCLSSSDVWPSPGIISEVGGCVRIPNSTQDPIRLRKHDQFCQIHQVLSSDRITNKQTTGTETKICHATHASVCHSAGVQVDPNSILPSNIQKKFHYLHKEYDDVFSPDFEGYNGAVGPYQAVVNMGPVEPPQRK